MTAGLNSREQAFYTPAMAIVEAPPSPFASGLLWAMAALLLGAIVWASVGEIEIVATAPGRLIPDGRIKVVQTFEPALIQAIHVREGQRVREGDLLIELDPTMSRADLSSSRERLQQNQDQMARLAVELRGQTLPSGDPTRVAAAALTPGQLATVQAREALYVAKLAEARASVEEKVKAIASAAATRTKLRLNFDLANQRYQKSLALVKEGFFSEAERLKQQQEVVSFEQDLAAQIQTLAQLQAGLEEARHRQTAIEQERKVQILTDVELASKEGSMLQAEHAKALQLNALKTLRAPVSGIVQSINVTTLGSAVAANQPLLTLVPEDTPLIAEIRLSNNDIGYVRLGQPVELKLDSFPFTQYGAVAGKVKWISPDAEFQNPQALDRQGGAIGSSNGAQSSAAEGSEQQRAGGLTYRVQVSLDSAQPGLLVKGQVQPLQSGMSLQADIQTDRRKLIQLLLNPLEKGWNEGTRVR